MVYEEVHHRIPLRGKVLLSNRLRHDMRWLGENNDFSNRLRFRLMIEKEFVVKRASIVPFVSAEHFGTLVIKP